MTDPQSASKITVACPNGHRLKGDSRLVGKTVRCPRCEAQFVFAPTAQASLGNPPPDSSGINRVSDTNVMRILGEMAPAPQFAEEEAVATRPCSRCGTPVPETLTVCTNCHCYLGVLPSYMQRLRKKDASEN